MRFIYKKRNKRLKKALFEATRILGTEEFYDKIESYKKFDNSTLSNEEISTLIRNYSKSVFIKTWKNRWSSSNAGVKSSTIMKINTAKLNRTPKSIINTIIHEYVHCVDFGSNNKLQFTHFDNSNDAGDENDTAPWAIGKIAEEMNTIEKF